MKTNTTHDKGWVAIWRKTKDSEIWIQEPWRFKTWIYLISEANHSEKLRYGQKLRRGQIYISNLAELCKQIEWRKGFASRRPSVNAMKQFWKWLRQKEMVNTRKTTRGSIITILNYNKYQDIQNKTVDTNKQPAMDTKETPMTSDDRQQLKQLEQLKQLNKKESLSKNIYKNLRTNKELTSVGTIINKNYGSVQTHNN